MSRHRSTDSVLPKVSPIPPRVVEEARGNPGGWVYEIDASVDPEGAVPPELIKGAWKVGDDGVPTGEFEANANYRPAG